MSTALGPYDWWAKRLHYWVEGQVYWKQYKYRRTIMDSLLNFLSGKKTFFVAALIAIGAGLTAFTEIEIPEAAWAILGALGLGAVRVGMQKAEPNE